MAPDLPYFLPFRIHRSFTHSLAGMPTIDLAVGLVVLALWLVALRAPVLDYSPTWLRERMAVVPRWRVRGLLLTSVATVFALEFGIATHLVLDLFTHEGGWFDSVAPWSGVAIGPVSVANLIHAVVSVALAFAIVAWTRRWAARTPRSGRATRLGARERVVTWVVLAGVLAIVDVAWWLLAVARGQDPVDPDLLGRSFFIATSVTGALAVVLAVVWWFRRTAKRG